MDIFYLQELVESIDANDNGISQYPTDLKPRYKVRTDLSSRVAQLNPPWNKSLDAQGMDVRLLSSSIHIRSLTTFNSDSIRKSFLINWVRIS